MHQSKSKSQSHHTRLPIYFLEPSNELAREYFIYSKLRKLGDKDYQQFDSEEIKKQLKSIREETIKNLEKNVKNLRNFLQEKGIDTCFAKTSSDAASYIQEVLKRANLKNVCINNSSVVKEIIGGLPRDIKVFDTYHASHWEMEDTKHLDIWEIPKISEDHIWNSFDVFKNKFRNPLKFASLVGANSVSSKDGSFFFVQHFNNISSLISQSSEIILVVSLEKIVKDYEQAKYLSRASGMFGLLSLLLGILSYETDLKKVHVDELAKNFSEATGSLENNIRVIILDNGRSDIAAGEFSEFLQCINCRACGSVCPRSLFMKEGEYRTPRELVLLNFTAGIEQSVSEGLYNCSLCGNCEIACPLGIPLPDFLKNIRYNAVKENLAPEKHVMIGENVRTFGNPYGRGD